MELEIKWTCDVETSIYTIFNQHEYSESRYFPKRDYVVSQMEDIHPNIIFQQNRVPSHWGKHCWMDVVAKQHQWSFLYGDV